MMVDTILALLTAAVIVIAIRQEKVISLLTEEDEELDEQTARLKTSGDALKRAVDANLPKKEN